LATLPFNQILLAQPLPNRPSSLAPPTLPQHFPKPVGFPTPNVRGVIQRNPQGQPANPSVED
jgi:hypothetical protein